MPNLIPHGRTHDPLGGDPMSGYPYDPAQGFFFVDHFLYHPNGTNPITWTQLLTGFGKISEYPDDGVEGMNANDKAVGVWTLDTGTGGAGASLMVLGNSANLTTSSNASNAICLGLGAFKIRFRFKVWSQIPGSCDLILGLGGSAIGGAQAAQGTPGGLYFQAGNVAHSNANGLGCWFAAKGLAAALTYYDTAVFVPIGKYMWLEMTVSTDMSTVTFKQDGVQIYQITDNTFRGPWCPWIQVRSTSSAQQKIFLDTVAISYPFAN